MRGCFFIASAQALAMATVTDTPFFLAARIMASGRARTMTWKVGMVREAVMEWETARSMAVMGRPWPGTCTSGRAWAGVGRATSVGRSRGWAASTSAAVMTPSGPVPLRVLRFTCRSAARRRA